MKWIMICVALLTNPLYAQNAVLVLQDKIHAPGDTMALPIQLEHTMPVSGARVRLGYDPSVFTLLGVDKMLGEMTLYVTEGRDFVEFVLLDPGAATILAPGTHVLAKIIAVVSPTASSGPYVFAVEKLEVADNSLPPKHLVARVDTTSIWVTENRITAVSANWVSEDEVDIMLDLKTDTPVSAIQVLMRWDLPNFAFESAAVAEPWRVFANVMGETSTQIVAADFSHQTHVEGHWPEMVSIHLICPEDAPQADQMVLDITEVLLTDRLGNEVFATSGAQMLSLARKPSMEIGLVTEDDEQITAPTSNILTDSTKIALSGKIDSSAVVSETDSVVVDTLVAVGEPLVNATVGDSVGIGLNGDTPNEPTLPFVSESSQIDSAANISGRTPRLRGLQFVEILADPPPGQGGDVNGDGHRDSREDEFVELLNTGNDTIDLSAYLLSDDDVSFKNMFRFPTGTVLEPGERVVLFGGGSPQNIPGKVFTDDGSIGNGLTNAGDKLLLIHANEQDTILVASYTNPSPDESLVWQSGEWVAHSFGWGRGRYSPGRKRPVVDVLLLVPARVELAVGDVAPLQAMAQYTDGELWQVEDEVLWATLDTTVVRVEGDRIVGLRAGQTEVWFFSNGRESLRANVVVEEGVKNRAYPGDPEPNIIISKVYPNPATGLEGDANGDGARDTYADEFVEIVNRGESPVDISGYLIGDDDVSAERMFRFPVKTVLASGATAVLFGGGVADYDRRHFVDDGRIGDGLSNSGDVVRFLMPDGLVVVSEAQFGKSKQGVAFVRDDRGKYLYENESGAEGLLGQDLLREPTPPKTNETYSLEMSADLIFREVLAVPDGIDVNRDDVIDRHQDGFVKLQNIGGDTLDLSGWMLGDDDIKLSQYFRLPKATLLLPGASLTIFGGGDSGVVGNSLSANGRLGNGLGSEGEVIHLVFPNGKTVAKSVIVPRATARVSWIFGSDKQPRLHPRFPGREAFSPGVDVVTLRDLVMTSGDTAICKGDSITLDVNAVLSDAEQINVVHSVAWHSNNLKSVYTEGHRLIARETGVATVWALWRDVKSNAIQITVVPPDSTELDAGISDSLVVVISDGRIADTGQDASEDSVGVQDGNHHSAGNGTNANSGVGEATADSIATSGSKQDLDKSQGEIGLVDPLTTPVNRLPMVISALDTSALTGAKFVYRAQVTDPDGDDIRLKPIVLPAWLDWDGQLLTGVPAQSDTGLVRVSFDLSDGRDSITVWLAVRVISLSSQIRALAQEPANTGTAWLRSLEIPDGLQVQVEGGPEWRAEERSLVWEPDNPGEVLIVVAIITELGEEILMPVTITVVADGVGAIQEPSVGALGAETGEIHTLAGEENFLPLVGSSPSPNPFNSATRFGFFTAGGPVCVTVYSVIGQPIRRLVARDLPPGYHQRIWDGTNDLGKPVSSGIYLVRLESQVAAHTLRVALLR